jgi:NDP-sugar pyrophosphorylase family protein
MRPLTERVPKVLLEVAGRPFVEWQLETLKRWGFADVVLCVAYLGEMVRGFVGDGARWGVRVRYVDEGPELLGTGGALRNAVGVLEEAFLVTYGDSYLPFDYAAPLKVLLAHEDCDGVMSVYKNDARFDASNVKTDGTWVLAYEKGTSDPAFDHIDYGALALRRAVVEAIPPGRSGLESVQTELARKRRMRAVVAESRFFEIGSPSGLSDLDLHLRQL